MLQNKFNETQFQFFFLFIRRIFFLENSSKNKKEKSTKYCKKKKKIPTMEFEHVDKKIKCNLYAVRLLSPIEPYRCLFYMYFVKF